MSVHGGRNMFFKMDIYRIQRREAFKYSGVIIFQEAVEITSSNLSISFFTCFVSYKYHAC